MDQQQSSSNRAGSTFVKCVGCEKLVRLPADPDPNSIVRCPRCDETYPIGVLLEGEIPELEIVDSEPQKEDSSEPEINIQTDEQNRFIVAPALAKGAKGAKRGKRRRSTDSESNGRAGHETPSRSGSGSETRRRSESSQRKRRKPPKKPTSSGGEILKVVLGAIMAPPVAQLVIWWGLSLDPLNLGPIVSKAIPIVVPEAFRADVDEKDSRLNTDDETENDQDSQADSPSDEDKKNATDESGWSG